MSVRKINDGMQNGVAGGATFGRGDDKRRPYEVIDDESGEVVVRCHSMGEAKTYAKLHNYGTDEWNWGELEKERGGNY